MGGSASACSLQKVEAVQQVAPPPTVTAALSRGARMLRGGIRRSAIVTHNGHGTMRSRPGHRRTFLTLLEQKVPRAIPRKSGCKSLRASSC